ncbi:MAG: DNA polymerase, partial [Candidatus Acidiferrales bacterium]
TVCSICEQPFDDTDRKVRDHCHITGKKRPGAAHSICNLNFKLPNFVPIIFHNLSGYDCHMFIKELCRHGDKIDVIAQTKEKYISFTKSIYVHDYFDYNTGTMKKKNLKLRFIDSFKFLSTSLANLGDGLDVDSFKETRKHFANNEQFDLMRQKGVFPYSFMDSLEKMNNPTLPTKNEFYDDLSEEHISDESYERAKKVWHLFGCKNLGEYSDLYLKSDVMLLSDVFEKFRDTCLENYKLDPCQYYTLPSFSFDCMLRVTKVNLELLTDIDTIHFFKKGIRGGISQCTERKHIANNIYLPNYKSNEPSSFIMYLDATNLYGHSMSQPLPFGGFRWLTDHEILILNVMDIDDNGSEGYVFEVDIHYPDTLHDAHSDLPFLVE